MSRSHHFFLHLDRVLKPILGGVHSPRFPSREIPDSRTEFAVQLNRAQLVRGSGEGRSRGVLFGAGGSFSKGKIRHFNEPNFDAVRAPLFTPLRDTRRLVSSRRRQGPESYSRWRALFDVLLRR